MNDSSALADRRDIERVVIAGAGQAGAEAALRLRQNGFTGDITLIGDEPCAPYQRPPLSKAYLKGALSLDRLMLRPESAYVGDRITLVTATSVVGIDRGQRVVRTQDGRVLGYDALILATGARPRALPFPGADLEGVFLFRTVADADALRPFMRPAAKLIVIGAGYIGLEAAAVARQLGLDVTVIETEARVLARVTSPEVANFFLAEHTRQGVRFEFGARAAAILGEQRVTGVGLEDGRRLEADVVIAGIGVLPEASLAQGCGLAVENGILTDGDCRTSDPNIFAVGDCAARPIVHFDNLVCRLESVHSALEGAKIVAAVLTGQQPHTVEAPWFWSDQYDLKLQIAGLFQGYDQVVLRGEMASRSFAAFYFRRGRMIAVDAVNRPAEFLGAKMLIQTGRTLSPELVADISRPMKELVANAR